MRFPVRAALLVVGAAACAQKPAASSGGAPLALTQVADVPLPGGATRFDW